MAARKDTFTVCHISPLRSTKGGITTVVLNYADDTGWPVRSLFVESHRDGTGLQKLVHMLRALCKTIVLSLSRRIDIVQVHVGDFPSIYRKMLVALPFLVLSRSRLILHMHGAAFLAEYERQAKFPRWLVRRFISRFDMVICLSERWRRDLQSHFNLAAARVLPNAVPVPEVPPERDLSGPRIFVFMGLIGARKGIFDLLEAAGDLKRRGAVFMLRVGGNGDIDRFRKTVGADGLDDAVSYLGWITGDARDDVMRTSHVLVLPSYAEGAPMSVIEGMAMGMPILSTRVGAIPEMVEDGVSGILVEPGDIAALTAAMERLCGDDALWTSMSRRSHAIARQHFSLASHKRDLLAIYEALIARHDNSGPSISPN